MRDTVHVLNNHDQIRRRNTAFSSKRLSRLFAPPSKAAIGTGNLSKFKSLINSAVMQNLALITLIHSVAKNCKVYGFGHSWPDGRPNECMAAHWSSHSLASFQVAMRLEINSLIFAACSTVCCRTVFVTAALMMASHTYPAQAAVWLITLLCPMTVELVSFYEITTRVESSHLQVSIYARANRNSCEAVNRKGNAEYSEKVIGTAQKKKKKTLVFVISVPTSYSRRIQSCF